MRRSLFALAPALFLLFATVACGGSLFVDVAPPTNVVASVTDRTHVHISWTASDDADNYMVTRYYAETGAPTGMLTDSTSFDDDFAFLANGHYYYGIQAYSGADFSTTTYSSVVIPNKYNAVAAMVNSSFALLDGYLYAWGENGDGRLGIGVNVNRTSPVHVLDLDGTRPIAISAKNSHMLALCGENKVYVWGNGDFGKLGLGDVVFRNTPQHLTALDGKGVTAVSAGEDHSLALCSDGAVYAWGLNSKGQLGLGDILDYHTPQRVTALDGKNVISITAGGRCSYALCSDGAVYAWGENGSGQLGFGDTTERHTPTRVTALDDKNVTSISTEFAALFALCGDHTVYVCGSNSYGELGLGDSADRHSPTHSLFFDGKSTTALFGTRWSGFAICAGPVVYGWGLSSYGQVGTGTDGDQHSPVHPTFYDDKHPVAIAGGEEFSIVLCENGSVYTCGQNSSGQLGIGDYVNHNTPQHVTFGD
ncbi:MAG: hypothetical protein WC712_07740 [Candidatus Brocadiia bacterium]